MVKKHKITSHKKEIKHKKISVNKNSLIIILIILALICGAVYSLSQNKVAATVNGEKIYEKRVETLYNSQTTGSKIAKSEIVQRLIDTKLLVQYIKSNGYSISEDEFNTELNKRLNSSGITLDDLNKQLSLSGATMEDVKENFLTEKFVNEAVIPNIHISMSDITAYRTSKGLSLTDNQIKNVLFVNQQKQVIASIIANQKKVSTIVISGKYK